MKFLAFSLSLRKDSCNRKLIKIIETLAKDDKVNLETLDLLNFEMPAYNQDLQDQQGFPATAEKFKEQLSNTQGLIIATPEYNYSYPGSFKNTFDWISRFRPIPWQGKPVLLLSASPALAGGERALWPLRVPFEGCGAIVYPGMFSLPLAYQAFNEQGLLIEEKVFNRLKDLFKSFVDFAKKLN